jgi:hypothetical protein
VHVVLQIEPMSNSLLYAESNVSLIKFLLITMQLFDDVLLSTRVIAILISLMVVVVTTDMM